MHKQGLIYLTCLVINTSNQQRSQTHKWVNKINKSKLKIIITGLMKHEAKNIDFDMK